MPTFTYPGGYIEELPGGTHTIAGVATSIAAFVGWAAQGPTGQAVMVRGFADFQNQFGGLDSRSYLGYAVNQFFSNGGQQAYIVRVVWDGSLTAAAGTSPTNCATAAATVGGTLKLCASSPGQWGNNLEVTVALQPSDPTRFNIQVSQAAGSSSTVLEDFVNLSANASDPEYAVTVIDNGSRFMTFVDPTTSVPPASISTPSATASAAAFTGGADGSVLSPLDGINGDGNFEIALGPDPATTDNHFGIHLLDGVNLFNLLCVPGEADSETIQLLQTYCLSQRAFYIVDCPQTATTAGLAATGPVGIRATGSITQQASINSAYYYPWIQAPDPVSGNRLRLFPPCGFVAGIYASTDATRGVWKAPAGVEASLTGVSGLQYVLTDAENGSLNVLAVNCLRQFAVAGAVVWGARTLQGNDQAGSQWKYISVRRLLLFLESSLSAGTQWVVFEPNNESLWAQIRLSVGSFMQGLFVQGAFQGTTPQQAYFVKCDSENNPQSSVDQGIVNILVGFAPLVPAEFVVTQFQQTAGQS